MDDDQKEVLKVGAEAAFRPFTNLIEKLFGGAVEQIGGGWKDRLAVRRQIRQLQLFKELQAAIDEAGFEPQQIPDFIWIPALQEASLRDDETIQQKWAYLLANAADPRQTNVILPSFLTILSELTSREVRFLDLLFERASKSNDPRHKQPHEVIMLHFDLASTYVEAGLSRRPRLSALTVGEWREGGDDLRADLAEFATTTDVLIRNRIIREALTQEPIDLSRLTSRIKAGSLPRSIEIKTKMRYHITEFGEQFVRACRAPSPVVDAKENSKKS